MTEKAKEQAPAKGASLSSLGYDGDSLVNGVWVELQPGVEIRVAQPCPGEFAKFCTRPENAELDDEELRRAFYGEALVREIRGADFEWTPQKGREIMLEKVGAKHERTDSVVEFYKFDPIFVKAAGAANNPDLYLKKAVGNSQPS